jgi:hypothetical protein
MIRCARATVACLDFDGGQEQLEPWERIPGLLHRPQRPVVGATLSLEVGAEIKQRGAQAPADDQEEHEQQPPESAVAVEERMDRLELRVNQADFQQRRNAVRMQVLLESCKGRHHLMHGRRHERRRGDRRPSDPIL